MRWKLALNASSITFADRFPIVAALASSPRRRGRTQSGTSRDPNSGRETFGDYAQRWIAERDLKPRTRGDYQRILDKHLMPKFGAMPMQAITPTMIRSWYAGLDKTTPTMRAHTYSLMRTITRAAVADDAIAASPCRIPAPARSSARWRSARRHCPN